MTCTLPPSSFLSGEKTDDRSSIHSVKIHVSAKRKKYGIILFCFDGRNLRFSRSTFEPHHTKFSCARNLSSAFHGNPVLPADNWWHAKILLAALLVNTSGRTMWSTDLFNVCVEQKAWANLTSSSFIWLHHVFLPSIHTIHQVRLQSSMTSTPILPLHYINDE